jgi:hypothetical protein
MMLDVSKSWPGEKQGFYFPTSEITQSTSHVDKVGMWTSRILQAGRIYINFPTDNSKTTSITVMSLNHTTHSPLNYRRTGSTPAK